MSFLLSEYAEIVASHPCHCNRAPIPATSFTDFTTFFGQEELEQLEKMEKASVACME